MALVKGTNSYVTVIEADAYFASRIDAAAYDIAPEEDKIRALVTATLMLDNYEYTGRAIDPAQLLAFPRIGSYFDTTLGMSVQFTSEIPIRITKATCELAYHLLNNDGILDNTGDVDTLKIGTIELRHIKAPSKALPLILNLIRPLRINSGSSLWWRAN
jgi:hypothetical protein